MYIDGKRSVIRKTDDNYPPLLREMKHAPDTLSVIGNADILASPTPVAVTGARKCSPYGKRCAEDAGIIIADANMALVTGGALGVQKAAIEGALYTGSCACIVVLGSGINHPYPESNEDLFLQVIDAGGAIISPYPDDMPIRHAHFKHRSELIAHMSACLVMTECGMPSAAFTMAETMLELDRAVLAYPGEIYAKTSAGCNHLIADGDAVCIDSGKRLADWLQIAADNVLAS